MTGTDWLLLLVGVGLGGLLLSIARTLEALVRQVTLLHGTLREVADQITTPLGRALERIHDRLDRREDCALCDSSHDPARPCDPMAIEEADLRRSHPELFTRPDAPERT